MSAQILLQAIKREYRAFRCYDNSAHLRDLAAKSSQGELPPCVYTAAEGILHAMEKGLVPATIARRVQIMKWNDLSRVVVLAAEKCLEIGDVPIWLTGNVR